MVLAEFLVGQVLWSLVWLALFVLWVGFVLLVFGDIIRSDDISGWLKAAWTLLILVVPLLGVIIYLVARGGGMSARRDDSRGRYDSISPSMAGRPVRY